MPSSSSNHLALWGTPPRQGDVRVGYRVAGRPSPQRHALFAPSRPSGPAGDAAAPKEVRGEVIAQQQDQARSATHSPSRADHLALRVTPLRRRRCASTLALLLFYPASRITRRLPLRNFNCWPMDIPPLPPVPPQVYLRCPRFLHKLQQEQETLIPGVPDR